MNSARAVTKYLRISPRKARLIAGAIRGLHVIEAAAQLAHSNLKGGRLLKKTLDSAVANAELKLDVRKEQLIVSEVKVDGGPILKRAKPKNKGGRHPIKKRMSHFSVVVTQEV